jgi:hypothetical protein
MKTLVLLLTLSCSILSQTYRYVDPEATGANNGSSWDNAWNGFDDFDINDQSEVPPGTTILIGPGTYTERYSNYVITEPGKPDRYALVLIKNNNHITFFPCAPGSMPEEFEEMSGEVIFESSSYEYGICLLMQQSNAVHDIVTKRITFKKFKRNAMFLSGYNTVLGGLLTNVVISDCKIGPLDEFTAISGGISCAAIHSQKVKDVTIQNCRIEYNADRNAQTDGLYFDRSRNIILRDNYIFVKNNYPANPVFHIDCIQFADNEGGKNANITIENNNIIQGGRERGFSGIIMTGTDGDIKIFNNNIVAAYCENLLNIHINDTTNSLCIYNNTLVGKENPKTFAYN